MKNGIPPVTPVPPEYSRFPEDLSGVEYFPARQGSAEATDQLRDECPVLDPDDFPVQDFYDAEDLRPGAD